MAHQITVKRPNGEMVTILKDDKYMMTPEAFLQAYNATFAAGRGEILTSTGAISISGDTTDTMTLEKAKAALEQDKINIETRKITAKKAKAYDNLYNEGAEGYNPYYA